ncbi:hypothetical protein BH11PAT1_BH11PAT1_4890 [soil metagenome]
MVKKHPTKPELKRRTLSFLSFFILPLSLIIFLILVTRRITLPYVGYNAWNYNIYSLIAHNYNQFGLIQTKFAPLISVTKTLPPLPKYYLHHPPLLSLLEAGIFRIFGESFWSGRLTVILFSIFSLGMIYLIAKKLKGKEYGVICASIASLVPGYILFGRMIGQEALVLFFCLSTTYLLLLLFERASTIRIFLLLTSIVLGVLSDWPMVYFAILFGGYAIYMKKKKLGCFMIGIAIITAAFYLGYIYWLLGNFNDLQSAWHTRSLGQLLSFPHWPLLWLGAIGLRIVFYGSPIVVILSCGYLYMQWKEPKKEIILYLWGMFGLIHVILYPEGSFGHPYWIIYLLPFLIFSSGGSILMLLRKKYFFSLLLLFLFSIIYSWKVESWKTKEIQGNMWRYELAQEVNASLPSYAVIGLSKDVPIDYDMFLYQFNHEALVLSEEEAITQKKYLDYYISNRDSQLSTQFATHILATTRGSFIIINLHTKKNTTPLPTARRSDTISIPLLPNKPTSLKALYFSLISFLHMPQL